VGYGSKLQLSLGKGHVDGLCTDNLRARYWERAVSSGIRSGPSQTAVIVAGMHRSGTSALTRVLNFLGAELGPNLNGPSAGNELGHWEAMEFVNLHEEMLQSAGTSWDDVSGVEQAWFASPAADYFRDKLVRSIEKQFSDAPFFAVKDPRAALFLPVWLSALEALGIEARFILPFRDPQEVAASLAARHPHLWPTKPWSTEQGEILWLRYNLAAEKATRGQTRSFVSFDALLEDWPTQIERVGRQLELKWPRHNVKAELSINEFINSRHRHHVRVQSAGRYGHSVWPSRLLDQLCRCVDEPSDGAALFDQAEAAVSEATRIYGAYIASLREDLSRKAAIIAQSTIDRAALEKRVRDLETKVGNASSLALQKDQELLELQKSTSRSEEVMRAALEKRVQDLETKVGNASSLALQKDQELLELQKSISRSEEVMARKDDILAQRAKRIQIYASVLWERSEELADARNTVQEILGSTSWRVTAIARSTSTLLLRYAQRFRGRSP
jgi:hypothetical protein